MIDDQKDSSIEAPTINMFSSTFGPVASITIIEAVLVTWFSQSKHTIKRGTITLTSYSNANQIAFLRPTKFAIMHNALKWGSNMIAIMLWTYLTSKDLKNPQKGLITFVTSNRIFLCRRQIFVSNKSNISSPIEISNNWASISMVRVMDIVKAFDNNQWPLLWFIAQTNTTRFKVKVIASVITHTWALGTICCRTIDFYLP